MITGPIEILINDTAVRALVGLTSTSDQYKIFPVRYPQEEKESPDKYITVYKTPGEPTQSKDYSNLDLSTFNVNCYASNYPDAYAMFEAVREALEDRSGTQISAGGFLFSDIWCTGDYDAFDDAARKFIHVVSFATHSSKV